MGSVGAYYLLSQLISPSPSHTCQLKPTVDRTAGAQADCCSGGQYLNRSGAETVPPAGTKHHHGLNSGDVRGQNRLMLRPARIDACLYNMDHFRQYF